MNIQKMTQHAHDENAKHEEHAKITKNAEKNEPDEQ